MTRYLRSQSIAPTQSNYALYSLMIATQGALDTSSIQNHAVGVRFSRPNDITNLSGSPTRLYRRVYFNTVDGCVYNSRRR